MSELKNATQDFFFSGLETFDFTKISMVALSLLLTSALAPMLLGIIWFERFGSDKKRTLINLLVTSCCFTMIQYGAFVLSLDLFRLVFRPLPAPVCFWQSVLRLSTATDLLLYFDAMAAVRFASVFVLKNPAAIQDDFWWTLTNIWIKLFSFFWQATRQAMNPRLPVGFYICCGRDPRADGLPHDPARGGSSQNVQHINVVHFKIHSFNPTMA